ncbi:hypothetical protein Tco_0238246 [Tanacetum coccineum]
MFPSRSEGEELEYLFFEGDGSSSDEWRDYGMGGDDYEGPPIFDDDQYEEESMPVYDTDIEDVIEEEEGFIEKGGFGGKEDNIEDVVVVANDICSSMIQTTLNVNFEEYINTKSHELVSFAKNIIIKLIHYCLENPPYKYQWIPNPNPDTPATPSTNGVTPIRPPRVMESYATILEEIKKKIDNQDFKNISYHKLYDVLKQHQNEVNEIRAERLARNANPLALFATTQQPVYHPQPKPTHYTKSSSTRSQAATRNKGKEIANTLSPKYDSEPEVVSDKEATLMDKEIEKLMALISTSFKKIYKHTNNNLKTSSNNRNKNIDNTPRSNRRTGYDRQTRQYENQRAVNVAGARENVGTQGMQEGDDTDDKPKDQELEARYMYMEKIQEVIPDATDNSGPIFDTEPLAKVQNNVDNYNVFTNERQHSEQPESINDTYVMEKDDRNIILDSLNIRSDEGEVDQDDDLAKEHDLLASLIEQMKCEIDERKNQKKCLESSNKAFKEANKAFKEANMSLANEINKYQLELDTY